MCPILNPFLLNRSVAQWSVWHFLLEDPQQLSFYRVRSSVSHLTRNLEEDQTPIFTSARDEVAHIHFQEPGSLGTSGVPNPVPIYMGPWGEFFPIHNRFYTITCLKVAVLHRHCLLRVKLVNARWFNLLIFPVRMADTKVLDWSISSGSL